MILNEGGVFLNEGGVFLNEGECFSTKINKDKGAGGFRIPSTAAVPHSSPSKPLPATLMVAMPWALTKPRHRLDAGSWARTLALRSRASSGCALGGLQPATFGWTTTDVSARTHEPGAPNQNTTIKRNTNC